MNTLELKRLYLSDNGNLKCKCKCKSRLVEKKIAVKKDENNIIRKKI